MSDVARTSLAPSTGDEQGRGPSGLRGLPAAVLIALISGYRRFISPLLGPRCRFYPSCSAYALDALRMHGALKGSALTVWRILRCQPFHPGGVDHVPPPGQKRKRADAMRGVSAETERSWT